MLDQPITDASLRRHDDPSRCPGKGLGGGNRTPLPACPASGWWTNDADWSTLTMYSLYESIGAGRALRRQPLPPCGSLPLCFLSTVPPRCHECSDGFSEAVRKHVVTFNAWVITPAKLVPAQVGSEGPGTARCAGIPGVPPTPARGQALAKTTADFLDTLKALIIFPDGLSERKEIHGP
ncbi:MAG: hypothetical protein FD153_420 [Rhodospirillaceae bacterium]|nr:MAG: hypothetical protein FD153_420 [Rhodospirillaceae bacterium]